jgi:hypothetical protein
LPHLESEGEKNKKQKKEEKQQQQQQPELINKIFDDIRVFFFAQYPFADKKESCDARRTQPASPKHSSGRTETKHKAETKKESNREEKATDEDGQRWTKMAEHRPDTGPRRTNIDEDGQRRTKTHGLRCRYWLPLRAATDILTYRVTLCTT